MNNKGSNNPNFKWGYILIKDFLIKEYIVNKKSAYKIAKKIKCGSKTIYRYLIKYKIRRRPLSEIAKNRMSIPEKCPNYKDGRYSKKHYCIDCLKESINTEICYANWWGGSRKCISCSTKGKNNPNYIDGKSNEPYTEEFTSELKEFIRKRDNHMCQGCGMTEKKHLSINGQVLHIHHIDYNKINCAQYNLLTLCQPCNLKANYNRDYWFAYYTYIIEDKLK